MGDLVLSRLWQSLVCWGLRVWPPPQHVLDRLLRACCTQATELSSTLPRGCRRRRRCGTSALRRTCTQI